MARKNLLDVLTAVKSDDPVPDTDDATPLPRRAGGAIGAVGRSFADLRANSVIDVPADMIDAAGLPDRIGDDAEHDDLVASIRDYGQQVPVLLRHSLNVEGRFEIVYGRRRVAALRVLGKPVRALLRALPDRDLIVAQGQENTVRKNLSFIELAGFAARMRDGGFDRKVIRDALNLHEAVVSKMLSVVDLLPGTVIAAIGDAPRTGRDRWMAFAKAAAGREADVLTAVKATQGGSDARFEAALAAVQRRTGRASEETWAWGGIRTSSRGTTISVARNQAAFAAWLADRMDDLHRQWAETTDSNATEER